MIQSKHGSKFEIQQQVGGESDHPPPSEAFSRNSKFLARQPSVDTTYKLVGTNSRTRLHPPVLHVAYDRRLDVVNLSDVLRSCSQCQCHVIYHVTIINNFLCHHFNLLPFQFVSQIVMLLRYVTSTHINHVRQITFSPNQSLLLQSWTQPIQSSGLLEASPIQKAGSAIQSDYPHTANECFIHSLTPYVMVQLVSMYYDIIPKT